MTENQENKNEPQAQETPAKSFAKNAVLPGAFQFVWELFKTVVIVFGLAFLIRSFVIQPFVVDGMSMYPRFQTDDYLLVDKLSYRMHQPQRGDIVVFHYPQQETLNYVKRIIGLPGETVHIENGKVSIINKEHPQGVVLSEPYINGKNDTFINVNTPDAINFQVPADNYFVMGDNRPASSDSREWGYLPAKDLIGRVLVQVYPLQQFSFISHARYGNI